VKTISCKVFEGRNIYSHRNCIKLEVDLENYVGISTVELEGFNESLILLLPEIAKHRCSSGLSLGFVRNLDVGTYLHHVLGHIAITLQNMIGADVSFCSENRSGLDCCYIVYEYKYRNTGIEAGQLAVDIINSIIEKQSLDLEAKMGKLKEIAEGEHSKESFSGNLKVAGIRKIPIIAITGTNGKTTTTRLIAYILSKAGYKVGWTTTDGIYINGNCIFEGDTTGPISARMVLENNEIDVAVLETARGGMVRDGLAYDLADIGVITNVADDHLGLDGIETLEDLAKVKALIGEAVKDEGYVVINGDNDMTVSIADRFRSKFIVFSEDKNNKTLIASIKNGGYGVYVDEGTLYMEKENSIIPLIAVADIDIALKGALRYNIQNAMAACGALIGFGIEPSIIEAGLETFKCNEELNPGRFNTFDVGGVMTILDYGHNIDGYKSVIEGLSAMSHKRLIGVIGVPGDRLDRTTLEVGRISGKYLDKIYIKEDKDRRGRLPGEVAEILKHGVLSSGFNSSAIEIVLDEVEALDMALNDAEPGDIVVTFFEEYEPLLRLIKDRVSVKIPEIMLA
jgi:UDP-N-acetylmuramyl tripeptide synthase